MDIKNEIVTLAVRYLNGKTRVFAKPDPIAELVNVILTGQTQEERVASAIVDSVESVAKLAKSHVTVRKFRKNLPDHI